MVNTRLEAALHAIHEDTLEQLADDLLSREGFTVEPTSNSGPDNKRDSLVEKDGELGIVHCSINKKMETKIKKDAQKAAERPEDFDFFLFFTNQDRSTVLRDRLEEEITEEYGFRARIRDFEFLRNALMGNHENHDLAREHLSVDPSALFENARETAEEIHEKRIKAIRDGRPFRELSDEGPYIVLHVVPVGSYETLADEIPCPPDFGSSFGVGEPIGTGKLGLTEGRGGFPVRTYGYIDEEGWYEGVNSAGWGHGDEPTVRGDHDKLVVRTLDAVLNRYENADHESYRPPFFVFLSLIGVEGYTMQPPAGRSRPRNLRRFTEEVFSTNPVEIESYDESASNAIREQLNRLWQSAGYRGGSPHFVDDEFRPIG